MRERNRPAERADYLDQHGFLWEGPAPLIEPIPPGMIGHLTRVERDEAVPVLPCTSEPIVRLGKKIDRRQWVMSDNPLLLGFLEQVAERLDSELGREWPTDEDLPPADFVSRTARRMLAVSGYPMRPFGTPQIRPWDKEADDRPADRSVEEVEEDAAQFLAGHWLCSEHKQIFERLCDLYFEYWVYAKARVPLWSSTGYPLYSQLEALKRRYFRSWPQWVRSWDRGPRFWYDNFLTGYAISLGSRSQADNPGKERKVLPYGKDERVVANKEIDPPLIAAIVDGRTARFSPTQAKRRRRRHVNAVSAGVMSGDLATLSCYDKVATKRFAFTWKHTSRQQLRAKLRTMGQLFVVDVKEFDQSAQAFLATTFNRRLAAATFPEHELHLLRCDRMPVLLKDVEHRPPRARFTADPLELDTHNDTVGQASGRPTNPRFNRIYGVFLPVVAYNKAVRLAAVMYDDPSLLKHRVVSKADLYLVLIGKHPVLALLNSGDDGVLGIRHPLIAAAMRVVLQKGGAGYSVLELDQTGTFLGWNICRGDDGQPVVNPNLVNMFVNFYQPEDGWGSQKRPYPAEGYAIRTRTYYQYHPVFRDAKNIETECFRQQFASTPEEWIRAFAGPGPKIATYADAQIIVDPSIVLWGEKIDEDDISEELASKYFITFSEQEVQESYSEFLPGDRQLTTQQLDEMLDECGAAFWLAIKWESPAEESARDTVGRTR